MGRQCLRASTKFLSLPWLGLVMSCGLANPGIPDPNLDQNSLDSEVAGPGAPVPFRVNWMEDPGNGLGLAPFPDIPIYQGVIIGCLSGFTKSFDENTVGVFLQNSDLNCQFRLRSLSFRGQDFQFDQNLDWSPGQRISTSGSLGLPITVVVKSQIATPVLGAQTVTLALLVAQVGDTATVRPRLQAGINLSPSRPIPLTLVRSNMELDTRTNVGLFSFALGCLSPVVRSGAGQGAAQETRCGGILLESLKIRLQRHPGGQLSLSQCRQLAEQPPGEKPVISVANEVAELPNGGLALQQISGPGRISQRVNLSSTFSR